MPQEAVRGANVIIFCCPHQFMGGIVRSLYGKVAPDAIAISLTKVRGRRAAARSPTAALRWPAHAVVARTKKSQVETELDHAAD